jgi:1-acyl-sn-glycerol-3-phosphate acyltransferase
VGPLLRACGHVDGGATFAATERLSELRARLDDGHPVLIFPEGTRSPRGGMHPVRRGAFTLAVHAQVPVRTLFLDCNPPALGKGVSVWDYPHEEPVLTLEVADVLDPSGLTPGALRDQFENMVRGRMAALALSRVRHDGGGIAA